MQDIASAVEMTPAAVYYHFASKEQILTEGMQQFRDQLLEEIRTHRPQPGDTDGSARLITHVLSWTARRRAQATVYFVNSIGLNLVVEALRRETREEMVDVLRVAVKSVRGRLSARRGRSDRRGAGVADRDLAGLDAQPGRRRIAGSAPRSSIAAGRRRSPIASPA